MDPVDHLLLRELEQGLPLVPCPYAEIGSLLGMGETEVIERIVTLKDSGFIRRIRARINQRKAGIVANALVAWKIPADESDSAGLLLSEFSGVTHCYERSPVQGRWDYRIYTVHHGWARDLVRQDIATIAEKTGYSEYLVLFSTDEYKREPHTLAKDMKADL